MKNFLSRKRVVEIHRLSKSNDIKPGLEAFGLDLGLEPSGLGVEDLITVLISSRHDQDQ